MTYEEKIRWLRRYQDSLRLQHELELEVERLRSNATRVTPLLSGMPGGQGDGQQLPRAVEAITEAQAELQEQILKCEKIRREVVEAIEIIDDLKDREIMRRRYLLGEKWRQVAESVGLDERWVRRIHHHIVCNIDYYRKMVAHKCEI